MNYTICKIEPMDRDKIKITYKENNQYFTFFCESNGSDIEDELHKLVYAKAVRKINNLNSVLRMELALKKLL